VPDGNTLVRTEQEAQALLGHLGRQLGAEVRTAAFPDVEGLRRALSGGQVDLAVLPNTAYRGAAGDVELLANFTRSAEPTHELLLLVTKSRGIQSVEELVRLNPSLGLDENHPSRRWFLIRQTGVDPAQAFRVISTPKQTVRAITDLITGTYDAACVESGVLDAVKRFDLGSTRQLQILASEGPYASDPLVVRKGFPSPDVERLRTILLGMEGDALGQQALLGLKIVRFVAPLAELALYPAEPPAPKAVAKAAPPTPVAPAPPPAPQEDPQARARAEAAARAEADAQRKQAYEAAARLDTAEAYRAFLALHAAGPEADEARKRVAALETETELFQKAKGSEDQLAAYLALWPSGRYVREARQQLEELRGQRREREYRRAVGIKTPEALRAFADAWPKTPQAAEAEKLLAALSREAAAVPAPVVSPPPPAAAPAPELPREWSLKVPLVAEAPAVDGSAQDAAWRRAPSVELPMQGEKGPRRLKVSMVHDGSSLYLLAEWPDGTRDTEFQPWVWSPAEKSYVRDARIDDGLAVLWYKGAAPASACLLDGQPHEGDTWHWRAGWSEISGLAEDGWIQVSRERLPQSTPYPSRSGAGQVWVRRVADEGEPGWKFVVPIEYAGDLLPSYQAQPARGSRGDVRARGQWKDGRWTVEMVRRFQTGHPDDLPLQGGPARHAVSFGAYDRGNMGDHTTSPVVQVEIVTR
jgi:ABC-type phosphate/phosphonate transport system substrate-binding protein